MNRPNETVPFVNLPKQFASLKEEIDARLDKIFEKTDFILGSEVQQFEAAFAAYCGAKHCVTLNSGTAALHLSMLACGIGPGDEVITVANTFIATAEGISFAGAEPRFVDCDEATYNMDVSQLEKAISPRTKAIVPVHLYGQPVDMDPIVRLAQERGLKVIEDACQAHGARYKQRLVGSISDIACFSFYPGKNLGAAGDGGAVVTNDDDLAQTIRLIRDHGSSRKYEHQIIGHNFRLDTVQAAVLNVKLPHLNRWNELRRQKAEYYNKQFSKIPGVQVPRVAPDRQSVFHLYVLRVTDRARLIEALKAANIQFGIHYPTPIHLQPAYQFLGLLQGSFPVSEKLSEEIVSLPMFAELTQEEQDRVIETIARCMTELHSGSAVTRAPYPGIVGQLS